MPRNCLSRNPLTRSPRYSRRQREWEPVTISGARTGTVGGAVPFGGYVISLERMNKIKSIDQESMTAVVEPGVILGDFQKAVEAKGLFYPPDPTEWSCQIGGTVATNASGARSFKYGATRGFVRGLRSCCGREGLNLARRGGFATASHRDYDGTADDLVRPRHTRGRTFERMSAVTTTPNRSMRSIFLSGAKGHSV